MIFISEFLTKLIQMQEQAQYSKVTPRYYHSLCLISLLRLLYRYSPNCDIHLYDHPYPNS
jgi:hypothetical protein